MNNQTEFKEVCTPKTNSTGRKYGVSNVRRWTETAKYCYKRGCTCSAVNGHDICFYKTFFESAGMKCQMKASVLELVRVLKKPIDIVTKVTIED